MDEFAQWDASETAERLHRRDVSPREVVEAAIRRAEARKGLGAIVTETFQRALDAATAKPVAAPALSRPFDGVPTAIKDLSQVAGVRTRWGSRGAGPSLPTKSDPFVQLFDTLGGISIGKTATPELGLTASTEPLGFPPCRNPWDEGRTPGGSSGGAAALVSAGVLPFAHASDGGGSIRIPASCCGLVGLKPTRGRIDMEGSVYLPINIAVHGVVTRTVRDTVAFWAAIDRALKKTKLPPVAPQRREPAAPLRIGLLVEAPTGLPVEAHVVEATRAVARQCEALGHHVTEMSSPIDQPFTEDFLSYWGFVAWAQSRTMRRMVQRDFDQRGFDPWTEAMSATFSSKPGAGLAAIWRLRAFTPTFRKRMFDRFDVVLSPTLAQRPPAIGMLSPSVDFETKRERLRHFVPFTAAFNASGCPAISLPLARDEQQLPIGVQFGADLGRERVLLELAYQLEQAAPWPRLAPWRPSPERAS